MVAPFNFNSFLAGFLTTTSFRRAQRSTPTTHPRRRSFRREIAPETEDLDIVPTRDANRIAHAIATDYRRHRAARRSTR